MVGRGRRRYGELQRCLPDVSKKMLTQTLRMLERDELVTRTVDAEVPPRVDYQLAPLGRSFLKPVLAICRWASKQTQELDAVLVCRKKSHPNL